MPKFYSLKIIRNNHPSGFIEYIIKAPNPQNNITGKSKEDLETFRTKMKKTLARLNGEESSAWNVWAANKKGTLVRGKKAIDANLRIR